MLLNRLSRVLPLYPVLGLLGVCSQAFAYVPMCNSSVYCSGELLHQVQITRLYKDSKTFVDMILNSSESDTLVDFAKLMHDTNQNPSHDQLANFVNSHFSEGNELESWVPPDYDPDPPILGQISDPALREFARSVISIWPRLGRRVKPDIVKQPDRYSFLYVPNGFIIPGGRFKELYYWDSYWIVRGLLISNMTETARGMIENLLYLVDNHGYVPNGSRIYYLGRSQPPVLAAMVASYVAATQDFVWLKRFLPIVEKELQYWLDNKKITVEVKGNKYVLLRYFADRETHGPRPESYHKDFSNAQQLPQEKRENFYSEIRSAAESGWDFSTRWFINASNIYQNNITDVHTTHILPVDLNSIFAGALELAGDFHNKLNDRRGAQKWWSLAKYWRTAIEKVLWDENDGVWYDYNALSTKPRKLFYLSCATPLWAGAVDKQNAPIRAARLLKYLSKSGALHFSGGVPTSMNSLSQEQWDFPNAWAPLLSILIGGLRVSGNEEAKNVAKEQAKIWVRANYIGFRNSKMKFEKYDVLYPGQSGGGGEYEVQDGFGWTNGVLLELLQTYGKEIFNDMHTKSLDFTERDNKRCQLSKGFFDE